MIISEKQIMQLIGNTHVLIAICDASGSIREDIIKSVHVISQHITSMLAEITQQQSEELKVIE